MTALCSRAGRAWQIWMTLEHSDISACLSHPELPIDLTVVSTVHDLFRVYLGRLTLNAAIRDDRVRLMGHRLHDQRIPPRDAMEQRSRPSAVPH
jgi:hypothetical protein